MNKRLITRSDRMPIIGKLKIGEKIKKENGTEYPTSLDYFKPSGDFEALFNEVYGEKPKSILIFFANNDALTQSYVLRDKELYAESDGINFRYKDFTKKEYLEKSCISVAEAEKFMDELIKKYNKPKLQWKKSLKMTFLLPQLKKVFGFWQFETQGAASMVDPIANIFDSSIEVFGQAAFIPFYLTVSKKESKTFGETKRFSVVTLTPAINPIDYNRVLTSGGGNPLESMLSLAAPEQKINNALPPANKSTVLTDERFNSFVNYLRTNTVDAINNYYPNICFTDKQKESFLIVVNDLIETTEGDVKIKLIEISKC